jgi:hypothetical protein
LSTCRRVQVPKLQESFRTRAAGLVHTGKGQLGGKNSSALGLHT